MSEAPTPFRDREILRLDDSWAHEISRLRAQAYRKFGDDLRNPNALNFGPTDRKNLNLGILENQKLVSVLRIEKHLNLETLELSLQSPARPSRLPTAVLSRAATAEGSENRGYGMLLRKIAIEALIKADYGEVFGTFKSSAKRKLFLESIGYKAHSPGRKWADFLLSKEPIVLVRLDLATEGDFALKKLEEISHDTVRDFESQALSSLVAEIVVFLKA